MTDTTNGRPAERRGVAPRGVGADPLPAPGVRLLDHLNLRVRHLAETEAWYGRLFGFAPVERGTYEGRPWVILRCADALLCLYEHPEVQAGALNHFALRVDDPVAFEERRVREGVALRYGSPVRWPHSTSWYVRDPSGHELEVVCWDAGEPRFGGV
ncbi:MAG: VOC family protein [Planctomycetota bacterium]|nr:MAG: VOC family protein [Planctomycetota bacterium]